MRSPFLILGLSFAVALGAEPQKAPPRSQPQAAAKATPASDPYRIVIPTPLAGWTGATQIPFTAEVQLVEGVSAPPGEALVLQSWINGSFSEQRVSTGQKLHFTIQPQDGENRVELRLAGRKTSAVRTFWGKSAVARLRIRLVPERSDPFWYHTPFGWLEVVEPGGAALTGGNTRSGGQGSWDWFNHAQPPAGTWTLRWKWNLDESNPNATGGDGLSAGEGAEEGDGEGQSPSPSPDSQDTSMGKGIYRGKVYVEVVLDAGTDRERRWIFDRLFLPGRAQITLGTFDVLW